MLVLKLSSIKIIFKDLYFNVKKFSLRSLFLMFASYQRHLKLWLLINSPIVQTFKEGKSRRNPLSQKQKQYYLTGWLSGYWALSDHNEATILSLTHNVVSDDDSTLSFYSFRLYIL